MLCSFLVSLAMDVVVGRLSGVDSWPELVDLHCTELQTVVKCPAHVVIIATVPFLQFLLQ